MSCRKLASLRNVAPAFIQKNTPLSKNDLFENRKTGKISVNLAAFWSSARFGDLQWMDPNR
jgi:hypothetical protein